MFKIVILALTFALCAAPALAASTKDSQTQSAKKGRSFEECQKRALALGMAPHGKQYNPESPNAKGFVSQCMRGEI
jgi:hypothetical protein